LSVVGRNPEENLVLWLNRLKTRLDNMRLTRLEREELDEYIGVMARYVQDIVEERRIKRQISTSGSTSSPKKGTHEEGPKKSKGGKER